MALYERILMAFTMFGLGVIVCIQFAENLPKPV